MTSTTAAPLLAMSRNASQVTMESSTFFLGRNSENMTSLFAFILSFSALRDWLKLIVVGGILDTLRRTFSGIWDRLLDLFYISASFQEDDPSYDWMMLWLSKHPSWGETRDMEISTRSFGLASKGLLLPGEEDEQHAVGTRRLAFLPSLSRTHSMWYKRRWMTVRRTRDNTGYYGRAEETLMISIMTRDLSILKTLLQEAKDAYKAAQEHTISIYVSDSGYHDKWRNVASRPKRPLRSIVLDPGVKELLLTDAREFLKSREWYVDRGIPFRRGYLLYGPPGTGKTSIIHSLAGELGLDVYIISLSKVGLDDAKLGELLSDLPQKCIAIMEDIDAAFHQAISREPDPRSYVGNVVESASGTKEGNSSLPPSSSKLTLSGLLNALDGVGAQEGRILYATTNKYHALDPALCRSGRMDVHLEFSLSSKHQARELFECFYLPASLLCERKDSSPEDDTSSNESSMECCDPDSDTPGECVDEARRATLQSCGQDCHNPKDISTLASHFANIIPEREFSMASLQGYLMGYKQQPWNAVKHAAAWVERERRVGKVNSKDGG